MYHVARDCYIACHAAYSTIAYTNCTNKTIIHQIQVQDLQHSTVFLGYTT